MACVREGQIPLRLFVFLFHKKRVRYGDRKGVNCYISLSRSLFVFPCLFFLTFFSFFSFHAATLLLSILLLLFVLLYLSFLPSFSRQTTAVQSDTKLSRLCKKQSLARRRVRTTDLVNIGKCGHVAEKHSRISQSMFTPLSPSHIGVPVFVISFSD